MKYITIVSFLISLNVTCQVWKEPFDTLPYLDHLERLTGDKIGIKSYSVTHFSGKDSISSYDFNEFNRDGYLIERFHTRFQNKDTIKYNYQNGIVQGYDCKREHIYNENKRLIEIRNSNDDSTWSIYNHYENNKLVEIRDSKQSWTTFQYDHNGDLKRKEIFQNGKLIEFFNYQHPNETTVIYQDCYLNQKGKTYLPCEITEGYFDSENRLIKIVSKYAEDSSNVCVTVYSYDKKGNLSKMINRSSNHPELKGKTVWVRDKKGLLIRIKHYEKGKLYLYSKFDYVYY